MGRIASKNILKLHKYSINQIFYKWLNTNKNLSFHKSSKVPLPALITRRHKLIFLHVHESINIKQATIEKEQSIIKSIRYDERKHNSILRRLY